MAVTALSGQRWQGITASDGWTETTGDAVTEIGSGTLDFDYKSGTYNGKGYYDLTTVSDTAWVLRFENINFSTWTTYGAMWLGISSITAQDEANSGSSIMTRFADFGDGDDYLIVESFNDSTTKVTGSIDRPAITASTNYNLEIIRDGTTITTNLYTTAFTGTPLATSTDTISGTTGLRYLFVQNYYSSGAGNANRNIIGTIDGIKFYNGITSVDSETPTYETTFTNDKDSVTDVPVGSEFEQTDDYKSYQLMPPTVALPTGLTASSYAINTTGGGASYMRVNQSTDLLLSTDDMTWSFWFYPTVIPSGEAGFFKPNGGTLSVWCYLREVAQKMAIGLKGSGGTVYAYGDTTPTVNKWNLATISWDYSAENISIYMNGREETVTQSGTSGALSGNFDDFIFFSNTTTGSEDLDGYVAEVAMWEDYWSDDTNHDALWNSYSQSTNVGGKSCNDLGTTLNNKLRYFFTGEYANTTGDVILNQAIGTDSESALKGTPTNLSRLDGGNSWVERGST